MLYSHTSHSENFYHGGFEPQSSALHPIQRQPSQNKPPLPSESLLLGQKIVEILHNGNLYKLQATKLGKLILTK